MFPLRVCADELDNEQPRGGGASLRAVRGVKAQGPPASRSTGVLPQRPADLPFAAEASAVLEASINAATGSILGDSA